MNIFIFSMLIFALLQPKTASAIDCPLNIDHAYKTPNSPAVYYIDTQCKKRPFRNSFIFHTYFSSWSEVGITTPSRLAQVPNHELGFMPLGPKYDPKYGALVKVVTDPKVYFLLNGKKYWVTSQEVFSDLHYQWSWIEDIDPRLLDKYGYGGEITDTSKHLDGTIIKYMNDPRVYVLVNGYKKYIESEIEFLNFGYRFDRIVVISDSEVYPNFGVNTPQFIAPILLTPISTPTPTPVPTPVPVVPPPTIPPTTPPVTQNTQRTTLSKNDFSYLGAFRLPKETNGGSRFWYGGGAMALNPHGDPNGANDGFPGSLYIVGHEKDQQVAEVNIPIPKDQRGRTLSNLATSNFLHGFVDITQGKGRTFDAGNGWRLDGLAYLNAQGSQTSGKIYWTARTYYNVDTSNDLSHGMSDANLSSLNAQGLWRLGDFTGMMTGGYIFPVPTYFADSYLGGKRLISGLFTQQGVSATSQGPAMFAYAPWQSNILVNGTKLGTQALLYYPYKPIFRGPYNDPVSNFPDHQVPDHWEAAAFLSTSQKHAVVVVGRRAMGETFYGDGRATDCDPYKGYHGEPYEPRIVFYNPDDLAEAAQGKKDPTTIVPYFEWNPSEFINATCEGELTGSVYDEQNRLLYVLHTNADRIDGEPTPLVYVFRVNE
jgi:hypothetical protein